ncbi:hypothetical protein [Massilia sp. AB1]|uniref:hypothetical protein n=1 Tax=Massilia sp. AB1 TaxID=2823371 RepID=UPI001B83055E|nr:hypothetical protein [Massilia sp. AB1]MBQ5939451.1 hypothetical protein [Massilia sp. AB1]
MADTDETLDALNEVHGQEKPDDVGLGEWIWGALQGDFSTERSAGQIGFDLVVSLIPIVDTLCDLRDLCANLREYRKDPSNKVTLFFIATTVVGFIPEVGTVVKGALRLTWVYLKPLIKHADDIANASKLVAAANRACDAALPKITEFLQHNRVAKWATDGKLPDIYQFVSKTIREAADKLSPAVLGGLLNDKFNDLKSLLERIRPIVPSTVRERIDDLLKNIEAKRQAMSGAIQSFTQPVRTVLKIFAKRLEDKALKVEVYRTNRGWIAPISEAGAARLINAKPPKWAKKRPRTMKFPPLKPQDLRTQALVNAHPDHPRIQDWMIATFSKAKGGMRADAIKGPAKLYRVVDPSNEGAGIFWMTEAEFKAIKDRDGWRSRFAVKPDWNQNGWVVEYEIKAGESLPVWRGPAASQKLEGTDYYLEGGGEQVLFYPSSRDEMVKAMPRIDRVTGKPLMDGAGNEDRRVDFTDVTGATAPTKLRARITDRRIKGPIETGWGATDYTPQEAQRILLTAPTAS